MHIVSPSRVRLTLIFLGLWIFSGFLIAQAGSMQPMPFLSPQQVPDAFLGVPYYGSHAITAYVDHDPLGAPYGRYNDRISLFDGRTAIRDNGVCGTDADGRPIAYYTQPFSQGQCLWYDSHNGSDFGLNYEPVLAAADGTVVRAGWNSWNNRHGGYGLYLTISHADGYETRYGHLSAITVVTNAVVHQGQIIGTSGNTGNSFGAHLHFEVRLNNQATDPFGGAGANLLWLDGSWSQGQWVGQPMPRYSSPFVVDDDNPQQVGDPNDDPNFTKGCQGGYAPPNICPDWTRATGVGIYDDMLSTYSNDSVADYAAIWRPPQPGLYDVQVHIPHLNRTTWWARYWLISTFNYMPGREIIVDQAGIEGDRWISVGIYQFGTGTSAPWYSLWLDDATGENPNRDTHCGTGWCQIGVDAVRFRSVWPIYLPPVRKDPTPVPTHCADC